MNYLYLCVIQSQIIPHDLEGWIHRSNTKITCKVFAIVGWLWTGLSSQIFFCSDFHIFWWRNRCSLYKYLLKIKKNGRYGSRILDLPSCRIILQSDERFYNYRSLGSNLPLGFYDRASRELHSKQTYHWLWRNRTCSTKWDTNHHRYALRFAG